MKFKEREEKFYDRFGIENSITEIAVLKNFRVGVQNFLADIDDNIPDEEIIRYCSLFGFAVERASYSGELDKNIYQCISLESNWFVYLHKLQELFYLKFDIDAVKRQFFFKIKELITSSKLSIDLIQSKGEYIIYPLGSSFLDNELIVAPLKFIDGNAHKHFIEGLKSYSNKNKNDYIKAAESMRRTLEEYLRVVFKNDKGLKENIGLVGKTLKSLEKQSEIRSLFHSFLDYLDKFYNDNSKHQDGEIGEAECELIILQTGLLVKYLDKIKPELLVQIK